LQFNNHSDAEVKSDVHQKSCFRIRFLDSVTDGHFAEVSGGALEQGTPSMQQAKHASVETRPFDNAPAAERSLVAYAGKLYAAVAT
jgi:hypothetical protein